MCQAVHLVQVANLVLVDLVHHRVQVAAVNQVQVAAVHLGHLVLVVQVAVVVHLDLVRAVAAAVYHLVQSHLVQVLAVSAQTALLNRLMGLL